MQETFEAIKELVKKKPSAEVFKIQSLDGEKIIRQSFDGKCQSCEGRYKKEGFLVLFTNY